MFSITSSDSIIIYKVVIKCDVVHILF
jgi:hypothetical protein